MGIKKTKKVEEFQKIYGMFYILVGIGLGIGWNNILSGLFWIAVALVYWVLFINTKFINIKN